MTETLNPTFAPRGVRGWLLLLCLMFVLIGPLLSLGLMWHSYQELAPIAASAASAGSRIALWLALALMAGAIAYGIHAGLALWRLRPGAVRTAKRALLLGLAADIVLTLLEVLAAGPVAGRLLPRLEIALLPSLLFFTLAYAYLNRSRRVQATYADADL
ncbi:DUF2569 family protein [Roseateles sp. DAIF2]|uniref:DUF2569 family protein n=1 Tax=Roseateles sp. DAIF2 TaxID=2714952 RepID=UPI0018A332F6|nr:DUF2569 family protein [Roseateles sp. DAIF2]QPF75024.1 DUF2569 family protein [Roseateles sp. DAIF2]